MNCVSLYISIDFLDQPAHIGYKTMSSITSWTDSHVSDNLLNLTSLSDISEVLTSKTNSANPKELTKALLSGGLIIVSIYVVFTLEIILLTISSSVDCNIILYNIML